MRACFVGHAGFDGFICGCVFALMMRGVCVGVVVVAVRYVGLGWYTTTVVLTMYEFKQGKSIIVLQSANVYPLALTHFPVGVVGDTLVGYAVGVVIGVCVFVAVSY